MEDTAEMSPQVADKDGQDQAVLACALNKSYGRSRVLQDLTMHVPRGSVYGLIGPNGAGKTTTLRIMATLERPDSGTVRVAGLDVRQQPRAVRARIGYMPDVFGVYEQVTIEEYLDFYAASYRIARQQRPRLCDELIELVDLGDTRQAMVDSLSRGMKQRLGLARALINDPEVLLLDEPASGLDPEARAELHDILRELSRLGKSIVISSHILDELEALCSHLGIVSNGHMVTEGSVEAVRAQVAPQSHLIIRLLDAAQLDQTLDYLSRQQGCYGVEIEGPWSVRASVDGSESVLSTLLAGMIDAGIAVTNFSTDGGTVKHVFFEATAREEATE